MPCALSSQGFSPWYHGYMRRLLTYKTAAAGQTQSSAYPSSRGRKRDPSALGQLPEHVFYIVFRACNCGGYLCARVCVLPPAKTVYREKPSESDVIESINADVVENRIGRIGSGFRRIFTPESNEQKARRAYKKYVNRRRGKDDRHSACGDAR